VRRPRRLLVATLALVGAAATLPALATTAAAVPALTVPADSVRIVAQFPTALVGAGVQITRDDGTRTTAVSQTIHSGLVPSNGLVSIDVPRAGLTADNGGAFLQVIAAVPVPGTKTALQSVASLGLTEQTLTQIPVITLTPPAPEVVPTYTSEESRALTGGGDRVGEDPPTAAEIVQMQAATAAQPVEPPHQDMPGLDVDSTGATGVVGAGETSPEETLLDGPANPSRPLQNGPDIALATPALRATSASMDQVTDARDIYGVYTFRSWSTQGYGMFAQFKMSSTAETITQNGTRTEAGAFSVNGTTSVSRQSSSSSTTADTWPKRSDCWTNEGTGQYPAGIGDGPDCGNLFYGFIGAYGNDTWRWERHVSTSCSAGWVCFDTVYETLRNRLYIGGTFNDDFVGYQDFGMRPSSIRAGSYGNWTGLLPGSVRQSDFNVSFTKARGATVGVQASWGTAFGSATFESTTSQRNESLASMTYELRDLKFSGTGGAIKTFYYYDYDGARRYDHFSCEFNTGWTSSRNSCWVTGS
jgi:hypothetical protein